MPLSASVTAIATSDLVKKILGPIAAQIGAEISTAARGKLKRHTHSFERYLAAAQEKHKYFSSVVFANEGLLLEQYYLPLTLQKEDSTQRKTSVRVNGYPADLFAAYKDILIVDTAGMGKSTLLKFIFLQSIKAAEAVPIFVELRKLSNKTDLLSFIRAELKLGQDQAGAQLLAGCLDHGAFTFFLDGFDEISDEEKKAVSSQITELKHLHNRNRFILSSREEESLSYLSEFHRFGIRPLSESEAFSLIKKITPDKQVGASLIKKVQEQNRTNLQEFLSNPLLVSLLVKSFLHSPILPVRLSEFYRQVFDALFQTHDARKELGGYYREKKCKLDLDRFHKTLRALGVLTYKDNKLEFSKDEILAQIERVKALTLDQSFSASDLHHDLLHSVPLFVRDGNSSRWAHRSLQEYFAASYICTDAKDRQSPLLLQLYRSGVEKNANLLRLCADIDGKTFKNVLVKTFLEELIGSSDLLFSSVNYPCVASSLLAKRRDIVNTSPFYLMVCAPEIFQHEADARLNDIFDQFDSGAAVCFLKADGRRVRGDDKVKFILICSIQQSVMDSIIVAYFGESIATPILSSSLPGEFQDVAVDEFISLEDDPSNSLYSPQNFELALTLVTNASYSRSLGAMKSLLAKILEDEANAAKLDVDFT